MSAGETLLGENPINPMAEGAVIVFQDRIANFSNFKLSKGLDNFSFFICVRVCVRACVHVCVRACVNAHNNNICSVGVYVFLSVCVYFVPVNARVWACV